MSAGLMESVVSLMKEAVAAHSAYTEALVEADKADQLVSQCRIACEETQLRLEAALRYVEDAGLTE